MEDAEVRRIVESEFDKPDAIDDLDSVVEHAVAAAKIVRDRCEGVAGPLTDRDTLLDRLHEAVSAMDDETLDLLVKIADAAEADKGYAETCAKFGEILARKPCEPS